MLLIERMEELCVKDFKATNEVLLRIVFIRHEACKCNRYLCKLYSNYVALSKKLLDIIIFK